MFVHSLIRGVRRLFITEMYTLMSMVGSDLHDRRGRGKTCMVYMQDKAKFVKQVVQSAEEWKKGSGAGKEKMRQQVLTVL